VSPARCVRLVSELPPPTRCRGATRGRRDSRVLGPTQGLPQRGSDHRRAMRRHTDAYRAVGRSRDVGEARVHALRVGRVGVVRLPRLLDMQAVVWPFGVGLGSIRQAAGRSCRARQGGRMSAVGDFTAVPSRLVIRCQDHPTYRGLSKPDRFCPGCDAVHRLRGATGRLPTGDNSYYTPRVGSA
jgi:hypothetical protein